MNGLALKFEGVSKLYPGAADPAVRDVSLAVEEGSFVTLLGTSGSGKTTLLKMVNRIIEPTSGSITLFGRDIRERPATELRRGIGYVIQQTGLFPHMTVEQNISTVPDILGWDKSRVSARVSELMELVQLPEDMRKRYPRQLSGGQQQRVGIARAMAGDPKVLLMDEPFGALDAITRSSLQDELLAIQQRLGRTVLFVTHDVSEAFKLGDRVVVMNGGRIEQSGTPLELLTRPATGFVRQLTGGDDLFQLLELLKAEDRMLPLSVGSVLPESAPSVQRTDSLKSALEQMLRHGASEAVVVNERGDAAGRLTLARLQPQSLAQTELPGPQPQPREGEADDGVFAETL